MNKPSDLLISLLNLAESNQGAGSILTAEELGRWQPGYIKICEESGLLRLTSSADEVICPGCEEGCLMPVDYLGNEDVLEPITYVACAEKGLIELEHGQLQNREVSLDNIAYLLAREFDPHRQPEKRLDSNLWMLGVHNLGGALYEFYLASFVDHRIANYLSERFASFEAPPIIVFFPGQPPPANLPQIKCINLSLILSIAREGVYIDHKRLILLVNPDTASNHTPKYFFHRNNAGTWQFRFNGQVYEAMKHIKGYQYIQYLLQNAGEEISAIKVAALANDTGDKHFEPNNTGQYLDEGLVINDLGDAGPLLDDMARQQYEKRCKELMEQLEEARELNDTEKAAEIEGEIDSIIDELKRATDRKGRNVKVASIKKRAQQTISSAIKRAISKLVKHCPELGIHLQETIKTGNNPIYQPGSPIKWHY
jgi:hypothetical protein